MRDGHGERDSALWGTGTGGRKRLAAIVALAVAGGLILAMPALAAKPKAVVPSDLLAQAQANPAQLFKVIVQGPGASADVRAAQIAKPGVAKGLTKQFRAVTGGAATLSGAQIVALAAQPNVRAITPDMPTVPTGDFSNVQLWPQAAQLTGYWSRTDSSQAPAIAVVDSGVDPSNPAFAGRIVAQANLYSGTDPNGSGDGFGHGTFVAGIAAGADAGHAGGVPDAKIVDLDVLDDQGSGSTSDIIAACDWILAHKAEYDIRVANISIVASQNSSFLYDPLDKAVESLWLNGVVVVAAAGNYGNAAGASGVPFAPGNDPFVLTVGAADTNGTVGVADDFAAPWSAWGSTNDGFAKPEISAPGRMLYGPVPSDGVLSGLMPDRVVEPGYLWMSGTSFASPVVAAAAAYVLAEHPSWTPDQVKGALMATAGHPDGYAGIGALGAGLVQADAAVGSDGAANPNGALDRFVSNGAFDGDTWQTTAANDPTWDAQSWASMSWASMSWASQSWASQSWASQSWASQSWASQSWASQSWASQSWASATKLR